MTQASSRFVFRRASHFFVAVSLATALSASAVGSGIPTSNPADWGKLAEDLDALVAEKRIPGAAVAVVNRSGVVWSGGFGTTDSATNLPITPDTLFRVGSISKSIVGLGVLRMVEDGYLDLGSPVRTLLPSIELPNPWDTTDPIRLVHLLEHTSGIEDQHFHDVYNLSDPPDLPLTSVLLLNPAARRVRWRPGTRVAYSNVGYTIVGGVLEEVADRAFDEHLREAVLRPLGMDSSTYVVTPDMGARLARGHLKNGEPVPFRHLYQRPASSLVSSAEDLSRLVQMLLNRGRSEHGLFLPSAAIDRMESPQSSTAARAGFSLGYGLGNRAGSLDGRLYHGHGGGLPDYSALYGYLPEAGWGFVVLTNQGGAPIMALIRRVLEHVPAAPSVPPPVQLSRSSLEQFTGYYEIHGLLRILHSRASARRPGQHPACRDHHHAGRGDPVSGLSRGKSGSTDSGHRDVVSSDGSDPRQLVLHHR